MAGKVPVRLGPRRAPGGQIPRIGVPDAQGREMPGAFLFHDVVNAGPDVDRYGRAISEPTEFVFVDRVEEIPESSAVVRLIQQGHLLVADPDHHLATLNVEVPEAPKPAPRKSTPKASKSSSDANEE